jgi:hypothetical protein
MVKEEWIWKTMILKAKRKKVKKMMVLKILNKRIYKRRWEM